MIDAWNLFFHGIPEVDVVLGELNSIDCDTVVSPANSFGFMDGGIDYAISERLGWDLQIKLQNKISELPEAELMIGSALIIETGDSNIPFLISSPTMRVPSNFNIPESINAYLAMKAALIKAKFHNGIKKVAIPGFCTGTGRMDKKIAAKQMFIAYNEVILGIKPTFKNFSEAQKYQAELNPQAKIWMG